MIALIDADIIVFRAGFAAERTKWFLKVYPPRGDGETVQTFDSKKDCLVVLDEALPGIHSREEGKDYQMWSDRECEPVQNALHLVNIIMKKIMDDLKLTEFDVMCYLSGGTNFRYKVAKTRPYKGNRDAAHRPTHEQAIRDYISSKWETIVTDGIEADDALGIAQRALGGDSVIVSIDKDLDMIPGRHYNFVQQVDYEIDEDLAWHKFCLQVLTGDTVDNIPGLPGIGPKKAEKILDGLPSCDWMDEVARQYASKSGKRDWFKYMMEQATLLWIQQQPNQLPPIPQSLQDLGGNDGEEEAQDDNATDSANLWD